jgi:hypothetical protein
VDGHWIIQAYHASRIPSDAWYAYIWLVVGVAVTVFAYVMIRQLPDPENQFLSDSTTKDNREIINRWWRNKDKIIMLVMLLTVSALVVVAVIDFSMAVQLLSPVAFIGIMIITFFYIVKGNRVEDPSDDSKRKRKTTLFLHRIDYRRHPISIPFILFVLIVISFLLSNDFDIPFNLEVSGGSRYVTSLEGLIFWISILMLASTFIYIINQSDFLGIKRAKQNEDKLFSVHYMEIVFCGAGLLIWLVTVFEALIVHFFL